jgi:MFS family permease
MTGVVWAFSAGVGPLLGGVFSEYLSWRWAFWINLPCCFTAFALLYWLLNTVPPRARSAATPQMMDWFGSATIMSMTILVLLSLDFGGVVFPWDSPNVLALLMSGIVLLAVFAWWEAKGSSSPLIPPRLVNNMAKVGPLLVCFTHGFVSAPCIALKDKLIVIRSTYPPGISSQSISKLFLASLPSVLACFSCQLWWYRPLLD